MAKICILPVLIDINQKPRSSETKQKLEWDYNLTMEVAVFKLILVAMNFISVMNT